MLTRRHARQIGLAVLLAAPVLVGAREFPERPQAIVFDRLHATEVMRDFELMPDFYGHSSLTYQFFQNSDEDEFQTRSYLHHALADFGRFRPTLFYAVYMLAGPVVEGTEPGAEAAQWIMNAAQFEYGVTLQTRMGRWLSILEYSRRSYHPLRGDLEEPAADLVRLGVAPPVLWIGNVRIDSVARVGWIELFDFWGTSIPDPRWQFSAPISVELTRRLGVNQPTVTSVAPTLFATAMVEPAFTRDGAVEAQLALQSGIALGSRRRLEVYFDYYAAPDTEVRIEDRAPVSLAGMGIRFTASPFSTR